MTSFVHPARRVAELPPIERPTLQEWTAAHQIGDANRRRVQLQLLHDRMVASRMGPWAARVYLLRHSAFFVLLGGVGALMAWLDPWVYVPVVIGLPLYGAWKAWRGTAA